MQDMTPLETYLGTHLRYSVWASRRVLHALGDLTPEEYGRELLEGLSLRAVAEQLFEGDRNWYELLAGEPSGLEAPGPYTELPDLQLDYRDLLRQLETLAFFLDDLELAGHFAQDAVLVPWLGEFVPKPQAALAAVSDATHRRGQLALLLRQLGRPVPRLGMAHFFLDLENPASRGIT